MDDIVEHLKRLYNQNSKHSQYQSLPEGLRRYIGDTETTGKSRAEKERLLYVLSRVEVEGKKVLDVGGNIGYFSFELLRYGAGKICYYEGNRGHARFVREAAKLLGVEDKIEIHNQYLTFRQDLIDEYDIVFLLNVLHHVGADYGNNNMDKNKALSEISDTLKGLACKTKKLMFQLGFNWKGDIRLPFFSGGLKAEMIDFVRDISKDDWQIDHIGIAQRDGGKVVYVDVDKNNIERDDSLGEFLNRPIFIMSSNRYKF